VQDTIDVLRTGPAINPSPTCPTRLNEATLAIAPPCVYAYLGRTTEAFGHSAVSLPMAALAGTVSPFDTGGLVKHIAPVKGWTVDARRAYLAHYSWPSDQIGKLIAVYPTGAPARRRAYLNTDRPKVSGPHEIWKTKEESFIASIWTAPNEWPAWLWEGRAPNRLSIDQNLVAWSCPAPIYGEILEISAAATEPEDVLWFEWLMPKYVDGGVSALVQSLRGRQEVA